MNKWNSQEFCDMCTADSFSHVSWNNGISTNKIVNTSYDEDSDCCYDEYEEPCCIEAPEDESEEAPKKKKAPEERPEVIAILFKKKSSYHNIHYMV